MLWKWKVKIGDKSIFYVFFKTSIPIQFLIRQSRHTNQSPCGFSQSQRIVGVGNSIDFKQTPVDLFFGRSKNPSLGGTFRAVIFKMKELSGFHLSYNSFQNRRYFSDCGPRKYRFWASRVNNFLVVKGKKMVTYIFLGKNDGILKFNALNIIQGINTAELNRQPVLGIAFLRL